MLGEIRDGETARIATYAALAGSLVLATIHANNAAGAILRLIQMGVPTYLLASAAVEAVSQRLVRLLCSQCKQATPLPTSPLTWLGETFGEQLGEREELPVAHPAQPRGCPRCRFTGYRGRTGIFEILQVSPSIRELIVRCAPQEEIETQARAEGMSRMRLDEALKVLAGLTTVEEVRRVTELEGVDSPAPG